MKTKRIILQLFILSSLFSCGPSFDEVPLDHFTINNDLLKDGTEVQLLSFSGKAPKERFKYYIHMIIVSLETSDTLNLLTIVPDAALRDENQRMTFLSEGSSFYQSVFTGLTGGKTDRLERVTFDKNFAEDINNSYPTVIGLLPDSHKSITP
ncbi:MAG: hypothetical protein ACI8ZN_002678 [Bacteroidia bacterium]|jgi:hypothetical protein